MLTGIPIRTGEHAGNHSLRDGLPTAVAKILAATGILTAIAVTSPDTTGRSLVHLPSGRHISTPVAEKRSNEAPVSHDLHEANEPSWQEVAGGIALGATCLGGLYLDSKRKRPFKD